jgi:hypothetical protein
MARMARNWAWYGAYLGLGLAIVALVLLAISPLGWRAGWWHFRFAFTWLMPFSGYIALAAAIASLIAVAVGWPRLGWRGLALAGIGFVAGGMCNRSSRQRWLSASAGHQPWRRRSSTAL